MKTIGLSLTFAAALLVASVSGASSARAEDDRQEIVVSAEQRDFMMAEMRQFLVVVQDIVLAMAENDMAAVAEAGHSMRMGQGGGAAMGMGQVLPLEFRQMARGTHMAFEELAQAAEFGPEGVLENLGTLMSNCTGCHATYKVVAKN
ncbi:hypothetical protein [Magnetovibrio sp.]|uniref:hypothetical protein n=1 Tax=Magnetovibrio sp. TaxID=2024836 RepID=UPI002F94D56A